MPPVLREDAITQYDQWYPPHHQSLKFGYDLLTVRRFIAEYGYLGAKAQLNRTVSWSGELSLHRFFRSIDEHLEGLPFFLLARPDHFYSWTIL